MQKMVILKLKHTYATLNMNFPPLVSNDCSCLPLSVPYK